MSAAVTTETTHDDPKDPEVLERQRVADVDAAVVALIARWDRLVREEAAIREEPAANLRVFSELRGAVEALREAHRPYDPEDGQSLGRANKRRQVEDEGEANEPAWLADLKREMAAV